MSAAFTADELAGGRALCALAARLKFHAHDLGALAAAINLEIDQVRRQRENPFADVTLCDIVASYLEARKALVAARIRARLALSSNVVALR